MRGRSGPVCQKRSDDTDGSVRLVLEVAPSFDLKAWIKGFLPHVRVARPASLRDEIAREIEDSRGAFPAP